MRGQGGRDTAALFGGMCKWCKGLFDMGLAACPSAPEISRMPSNIHTYRNKVPLVPLYLSHKKYTPPQK